MTITLNLHCLIPVGFVLAIALSALLAKVADPEEGFRVWAGFVASFIGFITFVLIIVSIIAFLASLSH